MDYEYFNDGATEYLLSKEYRDHAYDSFVTSEYLRRTWTIDRRMSRSERSATLTFHLLAALISNEKARVLVIEGASGIFKNLGDRLDFASYFDGTFALRDEWKAEPLSGGEPCPILKARVLVGLGCSPMQIGDIFADEPVPERGILIFRRTDPVRPLSDLMAEPPHTVDLEIDLGDGPSTAMYWGSN